MGHGQECQVCSGTGPVLDPLQRFEDIDPVGFDAMTDRLQPVADAISLCRRELEDSKALIGFAGAPWTVITYMIEGGSSRDFTAARGWMWRNDRQFDALLELVGEATVEFLAIQAAAGADVLMLFDSWAGAVPAEFRRKVVIDPVNRIMAALRNRGITAPVIGFPKGIGEGLVAYCHETDIAAVGLDHGVDPFWAAANLPSHVTVQGNLDPASLVEGGDPMLKAVDNILEAFADRPHIFNLGHGITPQTPQQHVHDLLARIRETAI